MYTNESTVFHDSHLFSFPMMLQSPGCVSSIPLGRCNPGDDNDLCKKNEYNLQDASG